MKRDKCFSCVLLRENISTVTQHKKLKLAAFSIPKLMLCNA